MNPYVIGIVIIIFVAVMLFYLYKSYNDGRKSMLDELYKEDKISEDTYKEYLD